MRGIVKRNWKLVNWELVVGLDKNSVMLNQTCKQQYETENQQTKPKASNESSAI